MKAAIFSLLAAAAVVAADGDYVPSTTSTVYSTTIYTITSCAPEYTDCPGKIGSVTTDVISLYETICPVTETEKPYPVKTGKPYPVETGKGYPVETQKPYPADIEHPYSTSTYYSTVEYTITACPPYVTNCPVGKKTSSVVTSTSICAPTSTHTYEKEMEYTTSTICVTKEYTSAGQKTWSTYTTTTVCPVTKATSLPVVKTNAYTQIAAPVSTSCSLSTVTYSTCVPSYYTKVVTVYPTTTPVNEQGSYTTYAAIPKGTGASYPASYPQSNGTYAPYTFTGGAAAQKAGGLLAAVGIAFAALL